MSHVTGRILLVIGAQDSKYIWNQTFSLFFILRLKHKLAFSVERIQTPNFLFDDKELY